MILLSASPSSALNACHLYAFIYAIGICVLLVAVLLIAIY